MFNLRFVCLVMLMVILLGGTSGVASASTSTPVASPIAEDRISKAFEFYPADGKFGDYFNLAMKPGETISKEVLLGNVGDVSQELVIYRANAFTAAGGGFDAAAFGTPPSGTTDWIDLNPVTVTLDPGKGITQSFTITVPENTKPGQYITAIVGEQKSETAVEGSGSLLQKLRYAIPVFITVPGETTAGFTVGSVQVTAVATGLQIAIPLENTGDVRVRPQGDVALVGPDGKRIASFPVQMQSIYAHDKTTLTLAAPGNFPPGKYSVTVSLKDEETGTTAEGGVKDVQLAGTGTEAVQSPVTLGQSTIEPGPSKDNVQFVTVSTIVSNSGDPIANGQLSLIAKKDGKEVERFPISQSLSVPTGDTPVSTRYIPAEGFTTGTWTFELLLETTDGSGAALVLAQQPIDAQVVIP